MKRLLIVGMLALVLVIAIAVPALAAATIQNGGFEDGNTGFQSDYTYKAAYVVPPDGGDWLWDSMLYTVGTDPSMAHGYWPSFGPHSGQYMLIANGPEEDADQAPAVWKQEVTGLIPGHVYTLSAYFANSSDTSPASLSLWFGSTLIGSGTNESVPGVWERLSGTFVVPLGATSGTLAIRDSTVAHSGNDYCIDDIALVDEGSTVGKTTGGIKFMAGDAAVQLNFVAMNSLEEGAKGTVKYVASNGNQFMGKVTGYFQRDDVACFVGEITKTNRAGWEYFYMAVKDSGEGSVDPADCGVRVLAGSSPYLADIALATGSYQIFTGNVQLH